MAKKRTTLTTTFDPEFIKQMKLYGLHKGIQVNQLIELAVRDYMKRHPVKE
jgi:hypothetical protein